MSIEAVRAYLKRFGAENRILELAESSATVELAAHALGVEGARIAKTLSVHAGEEVVLLVMAGDAKIHNGKFKRLFHSKPHMLSAEEALEYTGHAVGGVCPFALATPIPVYLDESLRRFTTVFPACGSGNSAIELTLDELERFSGAKGWVDVGKLPEEEGNTAAIPV